MYAVMKGLSMKSLFSFVLLLLIIGVQSTAAQESQCLEVWSLWSDEVRHEVNLDTGTVVSYEPVTPTAPPAEAENQSFDGRYSTHVEWSYTAVEGFRLELVDNHIGVSVVLAEHVYAASWSPNSAWLAYIQPYDSTSLALFLLNADGGETLFTVYPAGMIPDWTRIHWSPDGSSIAALTNLVIAPETWDARVFTTPDLTLLTNYEMEAPSPRVEWSPSGRYLVTYGDYHAGILFNSESGHTYGMALGGYMTYLLDWSQDETYVLISNSFNDWLDEFDVMTMQGELLLDHIVVSVGGDGDAYDWVNNHQIVARVSTPAGFYDLTFFDLQTGEQHILLPFLYTYDLSYDSRYAAAVEQDTARLLRFFDLTQVEERSFNVTVTESISNFIWRSDRLELIVLFEDRSLRGYNFETDTWREIVAIPGDKRGMRLVPCVH